MHVRLAPILLTILFACGHPNPKAATDSRKWYEGGTLHKATIREWKSASEENKLATCGDFMAKLNNKVTMEVLLERAIALRACINEASSGIETVDNNKVSEIAALCTVTLGFE